MRIRSRLGVGTLVVVRLPLVPARHAVDARNAA
jgi:hypothetical protein